MKEHFQVYPELLVLDLSMVTEPDMQPGQHLHGFLSMDALGNAKPVFVARSLVMSLSLLRRVCQDFKRTHPKWVETKVLVMNRLLPGVIQVLAREFPQAQVLMCQFHVLQLLNKLLADSQQSASIQATSAQAATIRRTSWNQNEIRQLLQQLVFAYSESRYNEAKALLMQQLSAGDRKELISVFVRDWEPYRALWVSYARTQQFDFSSFFTKGMNSFWEPMKSAFSRKRDNYLSSAAATDVSIHPPALNLPFQPVVSDANNQANLHASNDLNAVSLTMSLRGADSMRSTSGNSLAKCTSEILTMMKFVDYEWTSKMLILELTKPVAMDHCDPLLHLMANYLSGFAVGLVRSQLDVQSERASGSVTVTKARAPRPQHVSNNTEASKTPASPVLPVSEATVRWLNKMTREKHLLQRDGSACDCDFFSIYQLPCRHLIWYEVTALQHKQLSMVAVGPRWFLRSFQAPKLASQRESNETEYHLL